MLFVPTNILACVDFSEVLRNVGWSTYSLGQGSFAKKQKRKFKYGMCLGASS